MNTLIRLRRLVLSAAPLFFLAVSFGSGAHAQDATRDGYYASIGNPHPELPGFPKIRPSDVRIYANVFDPHPEITMPGVGVFATNGGGAPYPAPASTAQSAPNKVAVTK